MKTVYQRFKEKYKIVESGCWEWQACTVHFGYGQFWNGKRRLGAHRFAYELFIGEIEDGLLVCHKCDNPKCVSPFHLFKGTYSDNNKDTFNKGRYKSIPDSDKINTSNISKKLIHPSLSFYCSHGCRCEGCRACYNEYNKIRKLRKQLLN